MNLTKAFSFMVPKDRRFFPTFIQAANNLVDTSELLLKHFGSVEEIKNASSENLGKVVGKQKASILTEYFS